MRMSSDTRLVLGIALLVLGLISPAGTFLVAATDWPTSVKTLLGGILLFGLEIMAIPAAALMGKENFDRIVSAAKRLLKSMKPAGGVGRRRYAIGLVLFVGPLLFAWIASYVPAWLPQDYAARVWVNLALDCATLTSLFVLSGDFWDKLRALFLYEARAVFPASPASQK
jgi:hypothetical protein